jgi:hypothetical protein
MHLYASDNWMWERLESDSFSVMQAVRQLPAGDSSELANRYWLDGWRGGRHPSVGETVERDPYLDYIGLGWGRQGDNMGARIF